MKSFTTLLVAALAMPILALPPVPAALPPVVHADMEVMTNIDFSVEATP